MSTVSVIVRADVTQVSTPEVVVNAPTRNATGDAIGKSKSRGSQLRLQTTVQEDSLVKNPQVLKSIKSPRNDVRWLTQTAELRKKR